MSAPDNISVSLSLGQGDISPCPFYYGIYWLHKGAAAQGSGSNVGGNGANAPAEVQSLYKVQVGAFAYLENARQRLAETQAAGFNDAYIYQKMI